MGKTLRLTFIILIMASGHFANACRCEMVPLDESIRTSHFVAHLRIVGEIVGKDTVFANDPWPGKTRRTGNLLVEIIELFKGDSIFFLKEYEVGSSCETGLLPGEEWIVFARPGIESNFLGVGACSASQKLKDKNGERGNLWSWDQHRSLLIHLRNKFNHSTREPVYETGTYRDYYPNGKIEWEANYTTGKLNGKRKIWYSNGVLWKDENFRHGTKEGIEKNYARSGQLINELEYSGGHITHSVYWYDTSYHERSMRALFEVPGPRSRIDSLVASRPALIQKSAEGFDDPVTGWHRSKTFTETGALASEMFSHNDGMIRINCWYKDQKLQHEAIYWKKEDHTIEKKWNDNGELVSLKEWIKGKYQGDKLNR